MQQLTIEHYRSQSARANVEQALKKIEEYADRNIFLHVAKDRALQRADLVDNGHISGRLAGVPFAVKDNYLTKESPTTAASHVLEGFVSPLQATVIEKLEAEGAICIGKTNLDSFAHGSSTENSAFGPTLNAVDPTRVAGGSSGGSAVAVALGIVPFALGTDTGGSIRQPASFNGIFGVKPTYGLASRYGVVAMASSTDVMGCFASTAKDAELVTEIMSGQDKNDATTLPDYFASTQAAKQTLRIGVISEYMSDGTDPEVRRQVENYIEQLCDAGHTVEPVSLPTARYSLAVYYVVVPAEIASNLARYDGVRYGMRASQKDGGIEAMYGATRESGFMQESKRRILIGNYVLSSGYFDAYYQKAQKVRRLLMNDFDRLFASYDVLVSPVAPTTAFALGQNTTDPMKMYLSDVMTVGVSLAGLPALSVPAGTDENGLPIGVQLIANQKQDRQLFALAASMEARI